MPTFTYKARDKEGKIISGRVLGSTFRLAYREITKRKLEPLSLRIRPSFFDTIWPRGIRAKDKALFYRQMATMLGAGVSVLRALGVCKKSENKYLRKIVAELAQALGEGFPFSFTLSAYPRAFPSVDVGVIKAGEATANLEKVLKDLANETAHSARFVARIKGAMIYPIFILVTLAVIGVVMMIKVIPPIKLIFEEAKVSLPLTTQVLIKTSDFLIKDWWLVLLGLLFLIVLIRLILLTNFGKLTLSKAAIKLPIFGKFSQEVFLTRFARTFNLLLKSGIPIAEAVRITKGVTSNLVYQNILERAASQLEQGFALSATLEQSGYFPPMVIHLLLTGEQTGDLGGVFNTLVEYYEEEVEEKLRNFSTMIEPIVIVIIGIAVAFFILSVLNPIYTIVQIS